ncbi:MAG: Rab family GTPase [Promethearchaeota archaeon]|jgi:small GTP-binding protein
MSYRGKVILCGDAGVGKSSLLGQYVDGNFSEEYHQTLGANFLIKEMDLKRIITKLDIKNPRLREDIEEKGFKLYFWDLGGQHDKLFSNEYYFIQALGSFIIFDILNRESFENINFWIQKTKELSGEIPFIILGNKIDLNKKRVVSYEEAEELAKIFKVNYIETSAKTNKNVDKAFESLAVQILNNLK